jgi:hypothetical protein
MCCWGKLIENGAGKKRAGPAQGEAGQDASDARQAVLVERAREKFKGEGGQFLWRD